MKTLLAHSMLSLCFVGVISASSAILTNQTVRNSVESARPEGCLTDAQVNAESIQEAFESNYLQGSGSGFDCADCEPDPVLTVQFWCQSNLPFKCHGGPFFPKWEYERVRLRQFMNCEGFTGIRRHPWSDIMTASCCTTPQAEPACNEVLVGNRPVFLPECQPVVP